MNKRLVVSSRVKRFIKEQSGMRTSDVVIDELTRIVEAQCLKAIENAKKDKRVTVKDRDVTRSFQPPLF